MRTIQILKAEITNQNIAGLGFYSTTQHSLWFQQTTTSAGIDLQIARTDNPSAKINFPFFYLTYDANLDCLVLNVERYSYEYNDWVFMSKVKINVKWTNSGNGEYSILCNASKQDCASWTRNLPIIYRNT